MKKIIKFNKLKMEVFMKNYLNAKKFTGSILAVLILTALVLTASAFVYHTNYDSKNLTPIGFNSSNNVHTDRFKVYGLVCGDTFCITNIQNALYKIKGVKNANIDMQNPEAIVKFKGNIPPQTFIKAIDGASNAMFHYSARYIK